AARELGDTLGVTTIRLSITKGILGCTKDVIQAIDPFLQPRIDDESACEGLPDPWIPPEQEEGVEAPQCPISSRIKYSPLCGPYCPVTLLDEGWLYPGQIRLPEEVPEGMTDQQQQWVSLKGRILGFANALCKDKFVEDVEGYMTKLRRRWDGEGPVMPPCRVMILGAEGTGVEEMCRSLADKGGVEVVRLHRRYSEALERMLEERRMKLEEEARLRLEEAKRLKREEEEARKAVEEVEGDEGGGEENANPDDEAQEEEKEEEEESVPPPTEEEMQHLRQEAFLEALPSTLGPSIIDGRWVVVEEEEEGAPRLEELMVSCRRLPEAAVVLTTAAAEAVATCLDSAAIDREAELELEKRREERKARMEERERLLALPEPPEEGIPEYEEEIEDPEEVPSEVAKREFLEGREKTILSISATIEWLMALGIPTTEIECGPLALRHVRHAFRDHLSSADRRNLIFKSVCIPVAKADAEAWLRSGRVGLSRFFGRADVYSIDEEGREAVLVDDRIIYMTNSRESLLSEGPLPVLLDPTVSRPWHHRETPYRICVVGPPLSGVTSVARQISQVTGAVYLSPSEVLGSVDLHHSRLGRHHLLDDLTNGRSTSSEALAWALSIRLEEADCGERGWVIDGYPLGVSELSYLAKACGVEPQLVLVLEMSRCEFERRKERVVEGPASAEGVVNEDVLESHWRQWIQGPSMDIPAYLMERFLGTARLMTIDARRATGAVAGLAMRRCQDMMKSFNCCKRHQHQRLPSPLPEGVHRGVMRRMMGMHEGELARGRVCPVTYTRCGGAMVIGRIPVEYDGRVYWIGGLKVSEDQAHLKEFIQRPQDFVAPETDFMKSPGPPRLVATTPLQCEFEGCCVVALASSGTAVEQCAYDKVIYDGRRYCLADSLSLAAFRQSPTSYISKATAAASSADGVDTSTATKHPHFGTGKAIGIEDTVKYLKASVSRQITNGMKELGERRPLIPDGGGGPRESALRYLAAYLRAHNPLTTQAAYVVEECKEAFESLREASTEPGLATDMERLMVAGGEDRTCTDTEKKFDELFHIPRAGGKAS
ncbi:hypothetical protein FOZ63_025461, partial [Perkinsus olseni]